MSKPALISESPSAIPSPPDFAADRQAAIDAIEAAKALRQKLLAADASDGELEKAEAAIASARRAFERIDHREAAFNAADLAAKEPAIEAGWQKFWPDAKAPQLELIAALRAAIQVNDRLRAMRAEADTKFPNRGGFIGGFCEDVFDSTWVSLIECEILERISAAEKCNAERIVKEAAQ